MNIFVPIEVEIPKDKPPDLLSKEQLKKYSNIQSWKYNLALLTDTSLIAFFIYISELYWFNPFIYVLSVIVIGARMHGLAILMHETTHSIAYKTRKLNFYIGELIAWSLMIPMSGYRINHLSHHKRLNTDEDPDWVRNKNVFYVYPKTKRENILFAFLLLSGIVFFPAIYILNRNFTRYKYNKMVDVFRVIFYLSILTFSIVYNFWTGLLLYWLIPAMTISFFLLSYRGLAEHHGNLEYTHYYNHTRHIDCNWIEKIFLAQHNVEYHLAHHLYPQVPFYNLPKLHNALMKHKTYKENAHITKGYIKGFIQEITI
jgi:fatty acid desaturase